MNFVLKVRTGLDQIVYLLKTIDLKVENYHLSTFQLVEFGDTAFIVLRKRPLLFLHWYHHVTVLVYTWHAYKVPFFYFIKIQISSQVKRRSFRDNDQILILKDHTASGRWFIWMNYTVHAFMYTYYAMRAKGFNLPKWSAMMITVLQILQMVGGVVIGLFSVQSNLLFFRRFLLEFSFLCRS